jgi:peptidoglycan-associated lipoprotein
MKRIMYSSAMLVLLLRMALLPCAGQDSGAGVKAAAVAGPARFDLGLTITGKVAKISQTSNSDFGLVGGAIDGVYWFNAAKVKNLGLAFDLSGESASNIEPGVNLSQISFVVGPRYTIWKSKRKGLKPSLYAQALVGLVDAFNSEFPSGTSVQSSAASFAVQAGGGLNLPINRRIGIRAIEADYVSTQLPNNADSLQNDLRLSTGVVFHFRQ